MCFVRMADEAGVAEAENNSGYEFMGRKTWIERNMKPQAGTVNTGGPQDKYQKELIVKGLPFAANDDQIWEHFSTYGEVSSLNLLKGPDGGSKGICFVRMANDAGLTEAENNSGIEFMGRKIWIERSKTREEREAGGFGGQRNNQSQGGNEGGFERKTHRNEEQTVFVGNLSFNTDVDKLWEFFEPCGAIQDVRIGKKPDGSSRGFAHVEFQTTEAAEKAKGFVGRKLDGRAINVDVSSNKSSGGQGGSGGFRGGAGGSGGFRGGRGGGFGGGRGGRPADEGLAARKGHIDLNKKAKIMEL